MKAFRRMWRPVWRWWRWFRHGELIVSGTAVAERDDEFIQEIVKRFGPFGPST
jgi:hypothetical protein